MLDVFFFLASNTFLFLTFDVSWCWYNGIVYFVPFFVYLVAIYLLSLGYKVDIDS